MTPDVVAFAARTVSDGWQEAVSDELASALNDELWKTLAWRSGSRTFCHHLASIARDIEELPDAPKIALRWAVKRAIRSQGGSTLQTEVAGALLDHAADAFIKFTIPHLEETVRVLRVVGIWSCLQADLSLAGCECFKDLAAGKTKELIKAELDAKIDGYVRA